MLHYPDKVNKTIILSDAIVLSNLWISMIVHRRNLMGKLVVHPSISDLKLVKLVFSRDSDLTTSVVRPSVRQSVCLSVTQTSKHH